MTKAFATTGLAALSVVLTTLLPVPAFAHDPRAVADDNLTKTPRRDYLMACRGANPNAPGAQVAGPWLKDGMFYPDEKIAVQGKVRYKGSKITVTTSGQTRAISANNIPTHPTGTFPVARTDPAYNYDRNPSAIATQTILLKVPAAPQIASQASCLDMGRVGVMLTNVSLFNAVDARGLDASAHEVLDSCDGHPEQRGVYHYHTASTCQEDTRDASGHSALMGYALDGFGIFGPYDRAGNAQITNAELDECHGHVGKVMWDGREQTIYHYHLNDEFPFSVGCFRGTPVSSR